MMKALSFQWVSSFTLSLSRFGGNTHFSRGLVLKCSCSELNARGNDEIFGFDLLQHQLLHLHVSFGMTPVAQ